MTVFHLVRHAPHVLQDRVLVGRSKGVALSQEGLAQAEELGARFQGVPLTAILTSPRRRARETAYAIMRETGLLVEVAPALDEVDFGEWAGRPMEELDPDPRWREWNAQRSAARCPGGETMGEVWARLRGLFESLHRRTPDGAFALVTHAEPIRAALLRAQGRSFDDWASVAIAPGSVHSMNFDYRCDDDAPHPRPLPASRPLRREREFDPSLPQSLHLSCGVSVPSPRQSGERDRVRGCAIAATPVA